MEIRTDINANTVTRVNGKDVVIMKLSTENKEDLSVLLGADIKKFRNKKMSLVIEKDELQKAFEQLHL